ncbi:MAG: FMN-binding protein [Acidimicrobiales bacterium]|jgi:uncharacterized protein with FMN-binding domain
MKKTPAALASTAAGLIAVVMLQNTTPGLPLAAGTAPTRTPTTSTKPSVTRPGSPSTTTTTTPAGAQLSAVGTSEQYGYGVLSVKVTVSGHRIVNVAVASLQTAESYSQQLAQQVIPTLRSEVLSAQSAHVSAISGATYTSEAYLASLQAALDQLHV